MVEPGPRSGPELLAPKPRAVPSVLKGWGVPGSQVVGAVAWHSAPPYVCGSSPSAVVPGKKDPIIQKEETGCPGA